VKQAPIRAFVSASAGIAILIGLWQLAFLAGGPFVMPEPVDAFEKALSLVESGEVWQPAYVTGLHVAFGYLAGAAGGFCLGLLAGLQKDMGTALDTISTLILGVPPIIWIVLALLWFGPGNIMPAFTVAIGITPVIFAGAFGGLRSVSAEFDELALSFRAPWHQHFLEIRLPQISIALIPALATALGFAWKIALMAEVIGAGSGIGGKIADARSHLDTVETMAWVLIALTLLFATDWLLARATATAARLT